MFNLPNKGRILYGIVALGGYGDTKNADPQQSGGVKIVCPEIHGKGVDINHIGYSRNSSQGNQHGMTNNNAPPENGSAVLCYQYEGQGGQNLIQLISAIPGDIAEDFGIPGDSMGAGWANPALELARNFVMPNLNMPPKAGSGEAETRPPVEKGAYNTNMTKGIPSTAALWPLIGMVIPQVTNVSTAIQAFSQVLTSDMLNGLPGMNMSIGSLLDNMPSELKNELFKNLPPEVANALNAVSNLIQTIEIVQSGSFNTATKVNPDVFFQNAANLLSQARDITGIVSAFQQLQSNPSLAGLESLASITLDFLGGPFGTIPLEIDPLGNVTENLPEPVQKLIEAFTSLMSNGVQFPGVFPGVNMFGQSSQVMSDMFKRLPPEEMTKAVQQMQKNVAPGGDPRKAVNSLVEFSMTGKQLGLDFLKQLA